MKKISTFLLAFFCFINLAFACINDASSVYFESQPFPGEAELINGAFHIHSKEFYEWRIKDRIKKLQQKLGDPALLDDLSVSYEKTGQTQKAIDTLNATLAKYPERYETLANLGTFYIHHQEYEKGLALLKKAIKINPDAHYGREIYQIKAVEYLLSNNSTKAEFPIQKEKNFADFILKDIPQSQKKDELIKAIIGISGMLKFGNSDSPILFELLGDLYSRISIDYMWSRDDNPLLKISRDLYLSAYLNSPVKNISILVAFTNSKLQIFNVKRKGFSENFLQEESLKRALSLQMENRKEGIEKQLAMQREEIEILKKSATPEEDIFKKVMPKNKLQQESLFEEKKKSITRIIRASNAGFLIDTINDSLIYLNLFLIALVTIGLTVITYYINKIMFKFLSEIETISKSIKWMYLLLMGFIVSFVSFVSIFLSMFLPTELFKSLLLLQYSAYISAIIGICFGLYSIYFYFKIKMFNKKKGFKYSRIIEKTLKVIMYCYSIGCVVVLYYLLSDILVDYIRHSSIIN